MRKAHKIAEILGYGLYAERTEAGGFRFYDDSCGGVLNMFLDTTLLDRRFLELVLTLEPTLEKRWEAITKNTELNDECIRLED